MSTFANAPPTTNQPPTTRLGSAWRVCKGAAVILFVCWNLFFLAFRNPLDLWWSDCRGWFRTQSWWPNVRWLLDDRAEPAPKHWPTALTYPPTVNSITARYGKVCSVEQGWGMFTPSMARRAWYVYAELEFDEGPLEIVYSTNEFRHDTNYVRIGNWRGRKLEAVLIGPNPDDLARRKRNGDAEVVLWEAYARYVVKRWRTDHPNDPRRLVTVRLMTHAWSFPGSDEDPKSHTVGSSEYLGTFDPDGRLR
jgi:hypothetical protein